MTPREDTDIIKQAGYAILIADLVLALAIPFVKRARESPLNQRVIPAITNDTSYAPLSERSLSEKMRFYTGSWTSHK